MSSLISTPVGARPQATTALPATALGGSKAYGAQLAPASGNLAARLPVVDPVSLQNQAVSLSAQSLQRSSQLAGQTVDAAQKLMNVFVDKLFGDQARGATYSFDSVSVDAQSRFAAGVSESATSGGASRSAAFSLKESASFIGKGQLVTADGQTFDFEIEINYEASIEAGVSERVQSGEPGQAGAGQGKLDAPDVLVLTGKPLPAIKYPGSLDDLFKLLGKELSGAVSGGEGADDASGGNLTLRLLRLVDQAALLAPRPQGEDPQPAPAELSKAAGSYAAQALSSGAA